LHARGISFKRLARLLTPVLLETMQVLAQTIKVRMDRWLPSEDKLLLPPLQPPVCSRTRRIFTDQGS